MADTDWGGFTDVTSLLGTDVLLAARSGAGINFPVSLLLFKDASGRVGIGTASPTAPLHVAGNVNVDIGDLIIGRTTDAWGYIVRPNSAGYKNLRFATSGGGSLDALEAMTLVFRPGSDNATTLGGAANRWSTVYAATGTINTSDEREKDWRGAPTDAELRAARRIIAELGFYQWKDAVEQKGEDARLHFGVRAQRVWAIMAEEGLVDPIFGEGADQRPGKTPYAFLCWDEWDDQWEDEYETVTRIEKRPVATPSPGILGPDGAPAQHVEMEDVEVEERVATGAQILVQAAGNRFGVRTDQLTLFLIAAQARVQEMIEARLSVLEGQGREGHG